MHSAKDMYGAWLIRGKLEPTRAIFWLCPIVVPTAVHGLLASAAAYVLDGAECILWARVPMVRWLAVN